MSRRPDSLRTGSHVEVVVSERKDDRVYCGKNHCVT